MPGFDGTGPLGRGPMTGRGFGPCGRGLAFRRGSGRGLGMMASRRIVPVPVEYTKGQELEDLKMEKELLGRDLKAIEERIRELGDKK